MAIKTWSQLFAESPVTQFHTDDIFCVTQSSNSLGYTLNQIIPFANKGDIYCCSGVSGVNVTPSVLPVSVTNNTILQANSAAGTGLSWSNYAVSLSGNVTFGGTFTTSAGNNVTLTTVGSTNVTLPTTGTLLAAPALQSYTPSLSGSTSGSFTLLIALGKYYRVGNLVFINIYITWNGSSSPIGDLQLSLPAISGSAFTQPAFTIGYLNGINLSGADYLNFGASNVGGGAHIKFYAQPNGGATTYTVQASDCNSTGELSISGTYTLV